MKRLIILLIFLAACEAQTPVETGAPIEVLFCEREDCVGRLVLMLDSDDKCAVYRASLPEVVTALERADWKKDDERTGALMHNKFCVIDEQTVWTGSWNPTKTTQANNVVIVPSKILAGNYLEEFEELPGGYRRVRHPRVSYNNKLIENYFCPDDDCKEHVIEQLAGAKQSIRFMLSWITDEDIIATLNRRSKDIDVQGILDNGAYDESFAALPFAKEGDVHHKVFVIDGNMVITGSYNPTKSGDSRNDENILIIHDVAVAKEFLDEYEYLQGTARSQTE